MEKCDYPRSALQRPPFVIFQRDATGQVIGFRGFCFEIIHVLQEIYKFEYTVKLPRENVYGGRLPNGSWNGVIGMVVDAEVDMIVSGLLMTYSRQQIMDFTTSYYEEPTGILIPPPAEESKLLACVKPFQSEVWMVLLLVMVVLPPILWIQMRILWRMYSSSQATQSSPSRDRLKPTLYQQYLFVYAVLTSQSGTNISPMGHAPRFLAGTWCLCAVIFVYVYVSILVSVLSVPKLRPIIYTFQDLSISKLSYGVRRGTSTEAVFVGAREGPFRDIGNKFAQRPNWLTGSDQEGVSRVVNGSYAYIRGISYLEYAIEQDIIRTGQCRLSIAYEKFVEGNFAFPVTKGSQWQWFFNPKIQKMTESGLTQYWRRKYWPSTDRCNNMNGRQGARKLNVSDLQSAFFILGIGAALAAVAFIGECFVYLTTKLI